MADFQQTGPITTLHRLRPECVPALERRLEECARQTSIGLVLPALYSEFETPAMAGIAEQLAEVRYLSRIVVSLDRANAMQYERVKAFFRRFRTPVTVLWNDGGAVQSALAAIAARGLPIGVQGKGRGCWTAYGYLLARGDCDVIALHDCDIVDYDRSMLARLIQPLADPRFGYDFCKGYYARTNHRMNGRVTRLYIAPLVRALERMQPGTGFLDFFRAFRYPLAGEFAMRASLARVNRIPCDWGLEAGFLAEVYRNCPPSRVCQADIADTYEHKHQPLSPEDRSKGLRRMATEIATTLFRTLAGEGVVLGTDHLRTLQVAYVRVAEDMIDSYRADAIVNDLEFDRGAEELAISVFARSLRDAAANFLEDPLGAAPLPNWDRVASAAPEVLGMLLDAGAESADRVAECVA
jgi:glucosyl-3-phosphoglycerate synthase